MTKLYPLPELSAMLETERSNGKTIGLIAGCFDILHIGHINLLRKAKQYVDILVIELENDENIRTLKGEHRPVYSVQQRAEVLAELISVDYLFIVDRAFKQYSQESADYYATLIKKVNPNVLITSAKNDQYKEQKQNYAENNHLRLIEITPSEGTSTSDILEKIAHID